MHNRLIGQRVWYTPAAGDAFAGLAGTNPQQPLAGTIAHTWDNGHRANIQVLDATGNAHALGNILLLTEGASRPQGGGFAELIPTEELAGTGAR